MDIVNKFIASNDNDERAELMKQYQKIATTNLDTIGLTEYPGALIINKRFSNIPVRRADLHVQLGGRHDHP